MDFFDRQVRARRRTLLFLALYAATLAVTLLLLYLLVSFLLHSVGQLFYPWQRPFWDWGLFGWTALGSILLVGGPVLRRYLQLRQGGSAVAELLRGERLPETATGIEDRQLHNVVEEMAIASGIPKPQIYVFEREQGINALAAGFGFDDTVIGVTRGALTHLTRDELQGVVAHEFSHILNGDMRLNLWMICFLHGLLAVHEAGLRAVQSGWDEESNTLSWRHDRDGAGVLANIAAVIGGTLLMIIGYSGYLLARVVQCAIARQREHLADAAALQFTRNPHGLAGALKKVGGWSRHGLFDHPFAEEAGHLFFVDGISGTLERVLSTHPALEIRLRILDPSFDGHFQIILDERARRRSRVLQVPQLDLPIPDRSEEQTTDRVQAQAIVAAIGQLEASQLECSRTILRSIPDDVREWVRSPAGARAALTMLLRPEGAWEGTSAGPEGGEALTQPLAEACRGLSREAKIALVELCLPALHQLEPAESEGLRQEVERCSAGAETTLFQLCIQQLVTHHLQPVQVERRIYSLGSVWDHLAVVLAGLAHAGVKDPGLAWEAALSLLPSSFRGRQLPAAPGVPELRSALQNLRALSPAGLRRVIHAAVHCVASDGEVAPEEAELLRAVAAALGCPVPPLLTRHRNEGDGSG